MYAAERQEHVLGLIRTQRRVSVTALSRELDVTTETVRRDLDALEALGHVRRVHGGAVAADLGSLVEASLDARSGERVEAKRAIAAAVAAMLADGSTILIDAGSTTGALAAALAEPGARRRLSVITNALPIAATLHTVDGIEVTLIGGRLRGITSASVGSSATAQLLALRPDVAIIGANGLSAGFGLSTPDEDEAATKGAMVRSARHRIAVVDSSKLGVESLHSFADLADLDVLITDAAPEADLAAALRAADVDVVIA
jgi:DeoR family fructose operon transcriptional repressor